jgi:tight adherence protein B
MVNEELLPILVALLAAAAFAGVVFTLLYPYLSGDKLKDKRVASVTESRSKKVAARSAAESSAQRKKQISESVKEIEARDRKRERITLRHRLEQAGLDTEPRSFWIASVICGLLCFGGTLASVNGSMANIAAVAAGIIGTLGLPRWILSKLITRRQKKFQAELANSIDVIVRGVKSGLPLNQCLQIIARESPEPIGSEFNYICEQQRVGVPLAQALDRLIIRMPLAEVKFLAIVIVIQQQAGGNLSEALANLSGVLRDRFRMQMKVQALSAEAKASAMVLGSLPPGVMFMVHASSPEYIQPLFTTTTGNLFLLGGAFWMLCGILVMRKMINFKF